MTQASTEYVLVLMVFGNALWPNMSKQMCCNIFSWPSRCLLTFMSVCACCAFVCVLWDYFQYSRIFVYPQACCLQTASQNDLELIALTSQCVSTACVYTHSRFRQWPCPAPGNECLTPQSVPEERSVFLSYSLYAAGHVEAGVCEFIDATRVKDCSTGPQQML